VTCVTPTSPATVLTTLSSRVALTGGVADRAGMKPDGNQREATMNVQTGKLVSDRRFLTVLDSSVQVPYGDSVRVRKLGAPGYKAPDALYLVYVNFDANNQLVVRHMHATALGGRGVAAVERNLVAQAAAGDGGPQQVGRDFETMRFKGPTYFTIVIDNDNWDFLFPAPQLQDPPGEESHDPILFIERKVTLEEGPGGDLTREVQYYAPNTSFYNAEPVLVDGRNAVRCINFFTDARGRQIEGSGQNIGFEIYLRAPFKIAGAEDRKIVVIIDPDGQNQGPD
jgi:hypothetical protein